MRYEENPAQIIRLSPFALSWVQSIFALIYIVPLLKNTMFSVCDLIVRFMSSIIVLLMNIRNTYPIYNNTPPIAIRPL